mmetsp:Transcript_94096/g.176828  ORF Transcript_94096/g.176828 Transcript_94096/m.176828 type:complete len:212 (-) Transcript_94096:123-758(-)
MRMLISVICKAAVWVKKLSFPFAWGKWVADHRCASSDLLGRRPWCCLLLAVVQQHQPCKPRGGARGCCCSARATCPLHVRLPDCIQNASWMLLCSFRRASGMSAFQSTRTASRLWRPVGTACVSLWTLCRRSAQATVRFSSTSRAFQRLRPKQPVSLAPRPVAVLRLLTSRMQEPVLTVEHCLCWGSGAAATVAETHDFMARMHMPLLPLQ